MAGQLVSITIFSIDIPYDGFFIRQHIKNKLDSINIHLLPITMIVNRINYKKNHV